MDRAAPAHSSCSTRKPFAREDPYVRHGLVTHWRVREWTTVVGETAADPAPT
jgi:uncharacterized protein YciI